MAPQSAAVASGHKPHFGLFLLMAALMAALLAAKSGTRADPIDTARPHQDPQERGAHYEDHVLASGRLQREVAREGSTVRLHPRIFVPLVEIPARYFAMPKGHAGDPVAYTQPHESSARVWPSVGKGGFRIPDAIATRPDGTEMIYELKCPSPWLWFDEGSAWAEGMQTAFASQALAYFLWAQENPDRRKLTYGFCGLVPRWSKAILDDLARQFGISVTIRAAFLSADFRPADRLIGKPAQEAVTATAITSVSGLAPRQLTDAIYDRRKD